MKTILVTGGAGFIGSNFIKLMLDKYPQYRIINIDSLTYAGNFQNLIGISGNENYIFIKVDIRNRRKVEEVFSSYEIDSVVNFAAESHVDRSIDDPEKLIPLIINNCLNEKELPVYGDEMQIRDWIHVSDHCIAIDTVLHKGVVG